MAVTSPMDSPAIPMYVQCYRGVDQIALLVVVEIVVLVFAFIKKCAFFFVHKIIVNFVDFLCSYPLTCENVIHTALLLNLDGVARGGRRQGKRRHRPGIFGSFVVSNVN